VAFLLLGDFFEHFIFMLFIYLSGCQKNVHHPIRAIPFNECLLQWFSKTGMTLLRQPAAEPQ